MKEVEQGYRTAKEWFQEELIKEVVGGIDHPDYYGGKDNDFLKENFSKIIGDRYERES